MKYRVTVMQYVPGDEGDKFEERGVHDVVVGSFDQVEERAFDAAKSDPLYGPIIANSALGIAPLVVKSLSLMTKAKDFLLSSRDSD